MKRGHYKGQSLVDWSQPLSEHDKAIIEQVAGPRPEHKPVTRQPYDSLYLKMKRSQEI